MRALNHYHRIQEADLYAHFSPVEFIMDEKLLKTDDFNDALGDTSIWDRLKKLGEGRFYRVEYAEKEEDLKKMTYDDKRKKDKEEVEGKLKSKLMNTDIADTYYVQQVIDAFINKNKNAEDNIYQEMK